MSYTRLVAYSVVPALLIVTGLASGESDVMLLLAVPGGIAEAFILAKFFDRRGKSDAEPPLPPNVFK